jgi:methyl-accepting chemotaxis protein
MKLTLRTKLLGMSCVLVLPALAIAAVAVISLGAVGDRVDLIHGQGTVAIEHLRAIDVALADKAGAATYAVVVGNQPAAQAKIAEQVTADDKTIADNVAAFEALTLTEAERADLAAFKVAQAQYQTAFGQLVADAKAGKLDAAAEIAPAAALRTTTTAALDKLQGDADADAMVLDNAAHTTYEQAQLLLIVLLLVAVVAGLAASRAAAASMTKGVVAIHDTLKSMTDDCASALEAGLGALSQNDLSVEVHSDSSPIEKYGTDEIGQTAEIANSLLAKLKATVASYEVARAGLADTVNQVKAAAEALAGASDQLNSTATESGTASAQVAQTIGQVAAGAGDQARAASQTSDASHDLTQIIEQVGEGAASTRIRVQDASRALDATTQAIDQAMRDSQEMVPLNERVDAAVQAGAMAVDETAGGMKRIKVAVEATSAKVTELGAKGGQIGAIVETIDDIAEQTNLLALNAAIEAARAGEQGKGFAVVADEVRKLAERSSRATKEIAALIGDVQAGTEAAVQAMQAGAGEVATGAELAEQAAGALQEIRDAAAARNVVLEDMLAAVVEIRALSSDVVRATDSIAEIASETNAAAAQMGSASDTVAQSVDSIAAVSEENSAAAEEVSAATEQLSAQSEMVVAHAATLAEMAQGLDELVARFRLEQGQPTIAANIIPRRRASDWQAPGTRRTESA